MDLMKFAVAAFLLFILISCVDFHKGEYLNRIRSMEKQLASLQSEANEFDSLKLEELTQHYEKVKLTAQSITDTLSIETAILLDEHLIAMRKIDPCLEKISILRKNADSEKETLKNLKSDVRNSYGKRDKYGEYVSREEAKVDSLQVLLNEIDREYAEIIEVHEKKYAILLESLNNFTRTE